MVNFASQVNFTMRKAKFIIYTQMNMKKNKNVFKSEPL